MPPLDTTQPDDWITTPEPTAAPQDTEAHGNALDPGTRQRALAIYGGLTQRGMDPDTALGYAANAVQESRANPGSKPGDKGAAHGAFMWRDSRLAAYQFRNGHNPEQGDLDEQLDHVMWEVNGPEADAYQKVLLTPGGAPAKAAAVSTYWERPQATGPEEDRRSWIARQLMPSAAAAEVKKQQPVDDWVTAPSGAAPPSVPPKQPDDWITAPQDFPSQVKLPAGERGPQFLPPGADVGYHRNPLPEAPVDEGSYSSKIPSIAPGDDADLRLAGELGAPVATTPGVVHPPTAIDQIVANGLPAATTQTIPTLPDLAPGVAGATHPETAVDRVAAEIARGASGGWNGTDTTILPEKVQAKLDDAQRKGGLTGYLAALASTAAEDVKVPIAVWNAAIGAFQHGIVQAGEEVGEPQLGRDIAALPEAFPLGGVETGLHVVPEAATRRAPEAPNGIYEAMRQRANETPEQAAGRQARDQTEAEAAEREAAMANQPAPAQAQIAGPAAPVEAATPAAPPKPTPTAQPPATPTGPAHDLALTELERIAAGRPAQPTPIPPAENPAMGELERIAAGQPTGTPQPPAPAPQAAPAVVPPVSVLPPAPLAPTAPPVTQATPEPRPLPAPQSTTYQMFDPRDLTIAPKLFQYKAANEQGVTGALEGAERWEPVLANPITVWQGNDGNNYVVNGHQRTDLALRAQAAGQSDVQMPAQVFREADGYTPAYMRVLGAYQNISEGSGTAIDAAKVLRGAAAIPDTMRLPGLPPKSQLVQQGQALAKLSDDAFGMVVNDVVPAAYAAHVGNLIADPAEQMGAMQVLARADPANTEQARLMVEMARNSGFAKGVQTGLFGDEDFARSLIPERARVLDRAMRSLRQLGGVFKAAVEGEETLTSAGNTMNSAANTEARTENERLYDAIQRNGTVRGPVSDALNRAATDLAAGQPIAAVASRFLTEARNLVRRGQSEGVQPGADAGRVEPPQDGAGAVDQSEESREEPGSGLLGVSEAQPVPLYSPTARAVEGLKQARGTGEQMLAQIVKTPGVKPEELNWMNLPNWLRGQKSVTREQIADYVRANQLDVREVTRQSNDDHIAQIRKEVEGLGLDWGNASMNAIEKAGGSEDLADRFGRYVLGDSRNPKPKYGSYALPGGSNYREMLITLPSKENKPWQVFNPTDGVPVASFDTEGQARAEAQRRGAGFDYGPTDAPGNPQTYHTNHWDEPNVLAHVRFDERTGADGKRVLMVHEVQSDMHQAGRKHGYRNPEDADKIKAIEEEQNRLIEEVQKRHPDLSRYDNAGMSESKAYVRMTLVERERYGVLRDVRADLLQRQSTGVPDAPFKTSWPSLIMKRMLKYAADNGFDRVAWAPGEVQAARYDLSKQIKDLTLHGSGDNLRLSATDHADRPVIDMQHTTRAGLADIIGKEAADKLLSQPEPNSNNPYAARNLFGADLKVGGEGMKGFYDRILPAETQKIVGKYGAKVGQSEVGAAYPEPDKVVPDQQASADHGAEWNRYVAEIEPHSRMLADSSAARQAGETAADFLRRREVAWGKYREITAKMDALHNQMVNETLARGRPQPVHSVDITPAMRQAIQTQGLGLFQRRAPRPPAAGPDLFGATRAQPATRTPAPTLRTDTRQQTLEGMEPSARQAQASRDAQGPRSGQLPANEGLFGRPETVQPQLTVARPTTSAWMAGVPGLRDLIRTLPPGEPHQVSRNWVLSRGQRFGNEYLTAVDNDTGQIVHAVTQGRKNAVAMDAAPLMNQAARDRYTFHHNHPSGNGLSPDDLDIGSLPGTRYIVAHAGSDMFSAAVQTSPKEIARGVQDADAALRPWLNDMAKAGKISGPTYSRAYYDLQSRILHAMGLIDYVSTRAVPPGIKPEFEAFLKDKFYVEDPGRYATTQPLDAALAGLRAPMGEHAQGPGADLRGGAGGAEERTEGQGRVAPVTQGRLLEPEEQTPEQSAATVDPGKLYSFPGALFDPATWRSMAAPVKGLAKAVMERPEAQAARDAVTEFLAPMRLGPGEPAEQAFKFANAIREWRYQSNRLAENIRDKYTIADRWDMGRAQAEQSVFERKLARELATVPDADKTAFEANARHRFDATKAGHAGLKPEARSLVEGLSRIAEKTWNDLRDREMVNKDAEGWAHWMPRQLVMMEPGGKARRIVKDDSLIPGAKSKPGAGAKDIHPFGTNMHTDVPGFRNYEEVEDTLNAARTKYGPNVHLVNDIMALVGGLERANTSIAGHDLLQGIKSYGARTGTVMAYEGGGQRPGFTVAGNPAMWKSRPMFGKDETGATQIVKGPDGKPAFERVPVWVHENFRGPIEAVFRAPPGGLMKAFMALKAISTHFVMQSPLTHLQVELGRALPLLAGRTPVVLTLGAGRRARMSNDPRITELLKHGMMPISGGFFGDPVALMNEANHVPPLGALGRAVVDAKTALARGASKLPAGEFLEKVLRRPIQTLLWNRVLDLQTAIGLGMAEDRIKAGWSPEAAYTAGAHLANRYAGALPPEGMSRLMNTLANVFLFSRSFTGGNIGVMKDMFTAAPKHILDHIGNTAGPEAEEAAKSWMKNKARTTFVADIILFWGLTSLIQHAATALYSSLTGDQSQEGFVEGYVRRFHQAMHYVADHPIKALFVPNDIANLLPTADNEPGKEDRSRLWPLAGSPQYVYGRSPAGKVGEEFLDWATDPYGTLTRKQSTLISGVEQTITGKSGFGQDTRRPGNEDQLANIGRSTAKLMQSLFPVQLESDIYTALGAPGSSLWGATPPTGKERVLAGMQAAGAASGLASFSRGYPTGPLGGEEALRERQIKFDEMKAMPDVRRLAAAGQHDQAVKLLTDIGMDQKTAERSVTFMAPENADIAQSHATMMMNRKINRRGDTPIMDRMDVLRRSYGSPPP